MKLWEDIRGKHILFLQGPMGFFFKRLDRNFRKKGAKTFRIGLNAADRFFAYGDNYTPFRGQPDEWERFIREFLQTHTIDMIFLFGDCRFYQSVARKVAKEFDIDVFVFEEGYVRPHYITLEKGGVNGYSSLPKEAKFYHRLPLRKVPSPRHAHNSKTKMVISASLYYAVANLFRFRYPYYQHHRDFSALKELFFGIRGMWRKLVYRITERQYHQRITRELSKKYFFIPLQTHNDFQILQHSQYRSVEKFIIEVLESFAHNAKSDDYIVFKHHPVDRGRKNYKSFIMEQAQLLGIEQRVLVFHDVYLPDCLKHAKATVTINSTVGLSSIGRDIPTITLGKAVYGIQGLTNQMPLKYFWNEYKEPDMILYQKFVSYLIETTQLNGGFYGIMPKELE